MNTPFTLNERSADHQDKIAQVTRPTGCNVNTHQTTLDALAERPMAFGQRGWEHVNHRQTKWC